MNLNPRLVLSAGLLLLLLQVQLFRAAAFILIVAFLNKFLTSYKRKINLPIEIEILSFGIIISSITFGMPYGIVMALVGGLVYIAFNCNFSPYAIPMLAGYVTMALVSSSLHSQNIIFIGMISNLCHNLLVSLIYHFIFRYPLHKNIIYSISNICFNFLMFSKLGGLVLGLI